MTRYLKRWESPRNEGRNDKGRGGSARQRQVKKQMKALRRKLKEGDHFNPEKTQRNPREEGRKKKEESDMTLFLLLFRRDRIA